MIKELLAQIAATRLELSNSITQAVQATHEIAEARGSLQRTEDIIVNEIWANESYKNDKARNEQKHLARINDARLIAANDRIKESELNKARLHGKALELQNQLALLTLTFEHQLLGERKSTITIREVIENVKSVDTTEILDIIQKHVSELSDTGTESATYLEQAQKGVTGFEPSLETPTRLREILKSNMSDAQKEAALAAVPDKVKDNTPHLGDDSNNAPYLKNTSDKPVEKLGNIRI